MKTHTAVDAAGNDHERSPFHVESMTDDDGLERLSSGELHDLAVSRAHRHLESASCGS